jgi:DNA polymerase-3 subunit alpha
VHRGADHPVAGLVEREEHGLARELLIEAIRYGERPDIKARLTQEKTAVGFFLSGHLFEQSEPEVRQFCRTRIADLADSREPQLLAGITSEPSFTINAQRLT